MQVRTGARGAVAAAAALALVAAGATAVAASSSSTTSPTGLCLAEGAPATAAKPDGAGGFTCPSGRTLVVLASDGALSELRDAVGGLFGQVDDVRTRGFETSARVDVAEQDLVALQDRTGSAETGLATLQQELAQTRDTLAATRAQLGTVRSELTELQRRTALSTVSTPLSVAALTTRTVSCDGGRAVSGSARTSGTRVVQSAVTDDGAGWAFEVEPTARSGGSATLLVVCAGRTVAPGGVAPAPGTGPAPAPGTGTTP